MESYRTEGYRTESYRIQIDHQALPAGHPAFEMESVQVSHPESGAPGADVDRDSDPPRSSTEESAGKRNLLYGARAPDSGYKAPQREDKTEIIQRLIEVRRS
jgi:hypothetical protein